MVLILTFRCSFRFEGGVTGWDQRLPRRKPEIDNQNDCCDQVSVVSDAGFLARQGLVKSIRNKLS